VSKNVAVFVDVANIFYAAKAAGVDIDYVTLLKAATAGRDFVRAYAYTGLDPDNENQRQFHSFLARNGYKVISKDIRKYGDGRIKANLDIELVVDMMRMARNLDIAVVVSGDGDFAPAIRAVQQMGVRVDVISFRGNTSSDLIEVADAFMDIAQIARVDKGSARSGRRVAAEGDLSMTEVPEKETEGAPRRRRGRARVERPVAVVEPAGLPGNLIVLPGERLSRVGEEDEMEAVGEPLEATGEPSEATGEPLEAGVTEVGLDEADQLSATGTPEEQAAEEIRRRRRRRGGRGRGRGRRTEGEAEALEPAGVAAVGGEPPEEEEEEEFEEVGPAQLPHQTFGSVWDSQLGVPTVPLSTTPGTYEDEEELEEPEIPEYLLAERRQRGQGQGGQRGQRGRMPGRGRAGGGYQAAVDRERYGRGTPTGGGFGAPRVADRPPRPERGRGGRQQRSGRPPERPPRDTRPAERAGQGQRAPSDPWSEVPPELEDMLRAELARKSAGPPAAVSEAPAPTIEAPAEAVDQPSPRPTRRRATKASAAPVTAPAAAEDTRVEAAAPEAQEAAAPKRATRRRTAKAPDEAPATAAPEAEAKPKRASRARAKSAPAEGSAESTAAAPEAAAPEAAAKPARRRRTTTAKTTEEG
jgi:uncharacterized LabA/DUF88 family protein